jgi:hypothetical protein
VDLALHIAESAHPQINHNVGSTSNQLGVFVPSNPIACRSHTIGGSWRTIHHRRKDTPSHLAVTSFVPFFRLLLKKAVVLLPCAKFSFLLPKLFKHRMLDCHSRRDTAYRGCSSRFDQGPHKPLGSESSIARRFPSNNSSYLPEIDSSGIKNSGSRSLGSTLALWSIPEDRCHVTHGTLVYYLSRCVRCTHPTQLIILSSPVEEQAACKRSWRGIPYSGTSVAPLD